MRNYFVSVDLRKFDEAELQDFFEVVEKIRKSVRSRGYKLVVRPKLLPPKPVDPKNKLDVK
jgi:hypothetical protein